MAINEQYYSTETLENLRLINESEDELARQKAITAIILSDENDKARLFIDLFPYLAWRETQGALLRAIGETQEYRGIEFLIRFIRETNDLPLASQAALGLGRSQSSLAGEFLLSLLKQKGNRLRQEAIVGLTLMPHFYCDDQLQEIIADENSNETLRLFAIIAAGRRGSRDTLPAIVHTLQNEQGKLFNASILALGHLTTVEEFYAAYERETSSQLFADELRLYATDRCHLRKQNKIEDIVVGVLTDRSLDWCTSFRLLQAFSKESVWETIQALDENLDTPTECLMRAITQTDERADEDAEFLQQHQDHLDLSEAAILARLCTTKSNTLIKSLAPLNACKLLEQVYDPNILDLQEKYYNPETNEALTLAYINALVAQSFMTFIPNPALVHLLLEKLDTETNPSILARVTRGLAQMGCIDRRLLTKLRTDLQYHNQVAPVYYCLSLLTATISTPFFIDRLKKIFIADTKSDPVTKKQHNDEISHILKRLSAIGQFEDSQVLVQLPSRFKETQATDILRILTRNTISGYEHFIEESLNKAPYGEQLLAISAVEKNGVKSHCEKLLTFLKSESQSLRERAIHSLCLRGDASQQTALLLWFENESFEPDTALKILNTLSPQSGDDYSPIVKKLEQFIQARKGPFIDDDILAEAFSLYDTLTLQICEDSGTIDNFSKDRHEQDISLAKEIAAYPGYSETIKVILRNAELTWQHSELFNNLVDKSTMLIQYSKSTDLLLQHRLGYPLFNKPNPKFLAELQGRIMELGLDNAIPSQAKLIKHLNLEGFFTTREFPAHKLKNLVFSIMSGKIMNDRFRAIDGLRAWSLILLLFARTFTVENMTLLPILPVKTSNEEKINRIVKLMNKFQDLRNSAAHHGIVVELEQLAEIRANSFELLNGLEEVLGNTPKNIENQTDTHIDT